MFDVWTVIASGEILSMINDERLLYDYSIKAQSQ